MSNSEQYKTQIITVRVKNMKIKYTSGSHIGYYTTDKLYHCHQV